MSPPSLKLRWRTRMSPPSLKLRWRNGMSNGVALLMLWALALSGSAQVQFNLVSEMDGSMTLDNGEEIIVWGYSFAGPSQLTIPAPFLVAELGDEVDVSMFNNSPESHTIHLHGLDVDQANDGVPTTSFYVIPNEEAVYSFSAEHAGTFLYHCHVTTTIHLTMGMYGMIVVHAPDNQIYEGGPVYDQEKMYLASDLEVEASQDPTGAFPFHDIYPDYFMINGLSGTLLQEEEDEHIAFNEGEKIVLRLGSMAYSRVNFIFPEEYCTAMVHMSDGRVLEESYEADTLEIYPGERFTVMLEPEVGITEPIIVEYYSMLTKELVGSNEIHIDDMGNSIENFEDDDTWYYPSPTSSTINVNSDALGICVIRTIEGREVERFNLQPGINQINPSQIAQGCYLIEVDGKSGRIVIH